MAILEEYQALREANPAFDPVRPVMVANVRPCEHDDTVPLITDPATARVTDLFNVAYEILLQTLERYFAHTEENESQLATLADLTLALMFQVIKPLGSLITTLPAGEEFPGRTAGPSFELFYESDYLMPTARRRGRSSRSAYERPPSSLSASAPSGPTPPSPSGWPPSARPCRPWPTAWPPATPTGAATAGGPNPQPQAGPRPTIPRSTPSLPGPTS